MTLPRVWTLFFATCLACLCCPTTGQITKARLWEDTSSSTLLFPEKIESSLQTRQNNGVCFVGGGNRAYTSEVGFLRGLHTLGLIPKIKYMTGVSGGSWALTSFTYRQTAIDDETFLQPHVDTSKLDMDTLSRMPPSNSMAYTVASLKTINITTAPPEVQYFFMTFDPLKVVQYLSGPHPGSDKIWINGLQALYLQPLGIPANSYFTWSAASADEIIARNPHLNLTNFITVRPNVPFPIVTGNVLGPLSLAPFAPNSQSNAFTGIEFTPLYSGVSAPYQRTFTNGTISSQLNLGGLIESFAFGSTPVGLPSSNPPQASLGNFTLPTERFQLADAIGVSSMAPASVYSTQSAATHGLNVHAWDLVPRYNTLALQSPDQQTTEYLLGDGGITDNTGIMSLLRRGVQNIIVCDCSSTMLINNTNLVSLFGKATSDSISDGAYYARNQVFPFDSLEPLQSEMQNAMDAGKFAISTKSITTVRNDWWGIEAGMNVTLTWIFVSAGSEWISKLPQDTQQALQNRGAGTPFEDFPQYKTSEFMLSATQVNLLAALTADTIIQNADKIRAALNITESNPPDDGGSSKGLSQGDIAAIVICSVAGVMLVALIAYGIKSRRCMCSERKDSKRSAILKPNTWSSPLD